MKILLIEPDTILANTYGQAIEAKGHSVVTVPTAQSAIHAADTQRPDLVVLEMQLVSHSGVEFLYELRSYDDWQDVPVIIHSVVPPGEFIGSWSLLQEQLGVQKYLYKPKTSLAKLLRTINELNIVEA